MLFTNWLIANIIYRYDVDRASKSRNQASSGTINLRIFDNIEIVNLKFIRSVKMFVQAIIDKIKELKNIRQLQQKLLLLKKKKNVEEEKLKDSTKLDGVDHENQESNAEKNQ